MIRIRDLRPLVALLMLAGCTGRELRGRSSASPDGETYLVVADANGGKCGPLLVDGAVWPHAVGEAGRISPGEHVVACGTDVSVRVDPGQTFRLDYWGP
jgi:hypothetical protein